MADYEALQPRAREVRSRARGATAARGDDEGRPPRGARGLREAAAEVREEEASISTLVSSVTGEGVTRARGRALQARDRQGSGRGLGGHAGRGARERAGRRGGRREPRKRARQGATPRRRPPRRRRGRRAPKKKRPRQAEEEDRAEEEDAPAPKKKPPRKRSRGDEKEGNPRRRVTKGRRDEVDAAAEMSDKTEEATPKRLRKAQEEGDSPISAFASQSVAFLCAVALAPAAIAALASRTDGDLRAAIARAGDASTTIAFDSAARRARRRSRSRCRSSAQRPSRPPSGRRWSSRAASSRPSASQPKLDRLELLQRVRAALLDVAPRGGAPRGALRRGGGLVCVLRRCAITRATSRAAPGACRRLRRSPR